MQTGLPDRCGRRESVAGKVGGVSGGRTVRGCRPSRGRGGDGHHRAARALTGHAPRSEVDGRLPGAEREVPRELRGRRQPHEPPEDGVVDTDVRDDVLLPPRVSGDGPILGLDDPPRATMLLQFAGEFADAETKARIWDAAESHIQPTWDREAGEFTLGFGLNERYPRGQLNLSLTVILILVGLLSG